MTTIDRGVSNDTGAHTAEKMHWQTRAACRKADPDLFVIDRPTHAQVVEARAYCTRCPVAPQCFAEAVANSDSGIRGGRYLLDGKPKAATGVCRCGRAADGFHKRCKRCREGS